MEEKHSKVFPSFPGQHSAVLRVVARSAAAANARQTSAAHVGRDRLRGWLSFYEGTDIDAELKRLKEVAFKPAK